MGPHRWAMDNPNPENIKSVFRQSSCLVKTDHVQLPADVDPSHGQNLQRGF